MTANEAYELLKAKYDNLEAISCVEYPSRFVFTMISKESKAAGKTKNLVNGTYSVIKETKKISCYHPSNISFEEFLEGKAIESWNEKSAGENYIQHNSDMMDWIILADKK